MTKFKHYDAQVELLQALRSNEELTRLVVGGFHNMVARQTSSFPRIVYTEIKNADEDFKDNELSMAVVNFQVSIFCDEKTIIDQTAITKEVARTMSEIEYHKYDQENLYEEDTELYHRAMRFTKNIYL
ncbi:hypothetical protein J2Z83_000069 [Virgibacillus natechei]|uniref:DUF3168 domain-containing protein n=1 Tax=Virgibacillus natechei TaxID=1216297 RepID=A0ABS4IAM5_9BACI|nr:DUF3168 domain-containing protein [Virgibacillus natechei]MBP1967977.1 hypothetical protein [Virgibacillus natechei]UZD14737.1 DUF3168 domain-containing protein [Virgibacillus natechei]